MIQFPCGYYECGQPRTNKQPSYNTNPQGRKKEPIPLTSIHVCVCVCTGTHTHIFSNTSTKIKMGRDFAHIHTYMDLDSPSKVHVFNAWSSAIGRG